jgi:glycerophosphoryl diester phosphodiesterase
MQTKLVFVIGTLVLMGLGACSQQGREVKTRVIAHRGASGYLPEHTLEAYAAAYFMGADMIEPDVVSTRDRVLICFHDVYLEKVTDVESRFPDRRRADGHWYAIDFDYAELAGLTVTGRGDVAWDGFHIPTFDQFLSLIGRLNEQTGRRVWVVPEIKQPMFHKREGVDVTRMTIDALLRHRWDESRVIIQCFDEETLISLHGEYGERYQLLQLFSKVEDVPPLEEIGGYAWGIGPSRKVIDADPSVVRRAQALGMRVVPYTFRDEPEELREYVEMHGVDAVFTDYADRALRVMQELR